MLVGIEEFQSAARRLAGVAVQTGLHRVNPEAFAAAGLLTPKFDLFVKAESEQPIGSFKLRGAYNMVASIVDLDHSAAKRGFITYSSGNHAQGVAYAARALGAKAVIVMPDNAPSVKREATAELGAEIVVVGNASSDRKKKAEALAAEFGYAVIPPYDDGRIIAGQGTCGLEILEQLELATGKAADEDVLLLSPVSGGGLLSGVAAAVKLTAPKVKVWGAEPELSADAKQSFETKTLTDWPAEMTSRTICDGLRTQSLGKLNFEHVLRYVDGIVTVSEEDILAAMRFYLQATELVPEPSGAVTLAAALFHADELPTAERVVVILSGRNVEAELKKQLIGEAF